MRKLLPIPSVIFLFILSSISGYGMETMIPAFPGAEGFGSYTPGGRGGRVIFVTNLKDYNPRKEAPIVGSFRMACRSSGPRTIVFSVSGTIELKARLSIKEPFVTIAGQTAPGDGICIKNFQTDIKTNDVIVRYMRFRPGDEMGIEVDALWLSNAQNVIIDHCSTSWANDEVLSVTRDTKNLTVQWCMITESLHKEDHIEGTDGKGSVIGGYEGGITFHHNIYAHHPSRSPRLRGYEGKTGPLFDFRNNVIYNWGSDAGYGGEFPIRVNYVANYLKPGPQTEDRKEAFRIRGADTRMFVASNMLMGFEAAADNNWRLIRVKVEENWIDKPFAAETVTTQSADDAYEAVLRDCGATLPKRDSVDRRVVESIRSNEGRHIDSQSDVGGWPILLSTKAPEDTDRDGMPDSWEKKHGMDIEFPENNGDADGDGYTNIEEYLNGTDPNLANRLFALKENP